MEDDRIIAEEVRKNDRQYTGPGGTISGSIEKYILTVLPKDILAAIRGVSYMELDAQLAIGNKPSQILVDNMSVTKRGIERAQRKVVMRFQDTKVLLEAVREIYELLQRVTRLQSPPQNNIVARQNFYLYLNGVNLGKMPEALGRIAYTGILTQESVVRVVGPLVPYGRKSFWRPVGSSNKMQYYRAVSKRGAGVRFLPPRDKTTGKADPFYPRFKPYKLSTLKKKARGMADPAGALRSLLSGSTPPGRVENVGQIVKRLLQRVPKFKGLHFTDGWLEYAPAIGWSKLADPRVPAMGVMFARKGLTRTGE